MSWTRTITYQVLAVIALLLLAEVLLRVGHTVYLDATRQPQWFTYAADVGWDRRPNFAGADDCGVQRNFDEKGLVAEESARLGQGEGLPRVAFLGDSNTYGSCRETEETFVAVANRLLPRARFINLGVNGYTSFQGYKALLKYGKLVKPDVLFVAFNFNDRRFVLQPELADSDEFFRRIGSASALRRLSDVSYFAWAAGAVGKWFQGKDETKPSMIGDMEAANVRLDQVRPRVDPKGYRDNLNKIVAWARENGSAVAFILMGDNPMLTEELRNGLKHIAKKDYAAAIAKLEDAKDDEDDIWFAALARLHLAQIYKQQGLTDDAERVLTMDNALAGLTGGYPIFLDTDYHQIMREVAAEHKITVVDAASELSKVPEVYWDHCHFDAKGHEIVGRLVAAAVESILKSRMASTGQSL